MIDKVLCGEIISKILARGGEFAELFIEYSKKNAIKMIDGKVEEINSGIINGVGIRVFVNKKVVYAYTNDFEKDNLLKTTEKLCATLKSENEETITMNFNKKKISDINPILYFPENIPLEDKIDLMRKTDRGMKSFSGKISQSVIYILESDQRVWIYNSDNLEAEDRRTRTRLSATAIVSNGNEKTVSSESPGASMGFEFYNTFDPYLLGKKVSSRALRMSEAEYCPAGKMPVIISNGFGGVLFHEACGHSLEATSVAKGASVFAGKIGEKIANEIVSAVDDGTIPNAWGSANIDDEGEGTRKNVLIENGVLKSFLVDRANEKKLNVQRNGCSRRQNYTFIPTSRMSNTFIVPGDLYPEEIIAQTEYGLFAKTMGGGSVLPATGEFNFAVNEGYLIKNGKIDKPVKGATLIGKGHEILKKIDLVGNDLSRGEGMCGSSSGSIPADVGQPTIRISELTVGGRNK